MNEKPTKKFHKVTIKKLHEDFRQRDSPKIGGKIYSFAANSLSKISAQRESYENPTKLGDKVFGAKIIFSNSAQRESYEN